MDYSRNNYDINTCLFILMLKGHNMRRKGEVIPKKILMMGCGGGLAFWCHLDVNLNNSNSRFIMC